MGPADGLPRAVDPLHRLRRPPRRPLPLLPRPRRCSRSTLGTRYVGDMDRLFDTYAELLPDARRPLPRRRSPRTPPTRDFVYRQAIRAKALDALRGILPGGVAVERRHLRHRPGATRRCCCACARTRCPRPAPTPTSCSPSCARSSRPSCKRVDLADRGGAWSDYLGRQPQRHGRASRHGCSRRRPTPSRAGRSPSSTSTPTARSSSSPRMLLRRTRNLPEDQLEARVRRMSAPTSAWRSLRAYVGERANRRHKPGPGLRAHRLPLRRPRRLRRLPRPPAPPHAHHRVAAAHARTTATPGPRPSTRPALADALRRGHGALGRALRRRSPSRFPDQAVLRRVAGLPGALRDADERPRGDAPARAAHRARRATPPTGGSARRCTASSPSRPATAPSPR